MKILTLNPLSTSAITDNLQVVGATDGASAQNDLTKTSVGTVTNPYGHVDSVHVENLARFFTSYTQLAIATLGVYPQKYGTSRFFGSSSGQYYAFVNDTTNISSANDVVILEGSNGYSPDLFLNSYTTMNETVPLVGAGVLPLSAPGAGTVFTPSTDPLPATIGGKSYPTVQVNAPWEEAPLATAQRIIPDFYTTSGVSCIQPKDQFGGTTQTANGSNIVSVTNGTGIVIGMPISGVSVPTSTTVTATSNIATLTGVTVTPSAGTLTYTVSGYSASASFSNGDAINVTGATPSYYNIASSLGYTATAVTATSFTTTDPNSQTISGIVANGNQIVFTTTNAHNYSVGQAVLTDGTGVAAFNFTSSAQTITAVTTYTFTISSTATGTYTSGGNATISSGAWVASNAIATDTSQIVISNNATGNGAVSFPNNVMTFANSDANSLAVGQVITDNGNHFIGVVSSVDPSGNFLMLTGAAAISLSNASIFACTLISNIDGTYAGANNNIMYDSYNKSITVSGNTAQIYGASAGQTTTGWTASVSGNTASYQPASGTFNNYLVGQKVTITGFTNTSFNGTFYITVASTGAFSVTSTATGTATGTGTVQAVGTTYYSYNQFAGGENVAVTGFTGTATGFNTSGTIIATNPNLFQIASSLTATASGVALATVSSAKYMLPNQSTAILTSATATGSSTSTGSVTYTVSGTNPFTVGEIVTITGFSSTAYNLSLATIASVTTSTITISTNSITNAGNVTGTGTATLNPPIYDGNGLLVGYVNSQNSGATYGTIINNPSVTFSIQNNPLQVSASNNNSAGFGSGWNNSNPTQTEIVAGQYVFPIQTYNPFFSASASPAFNVANYDNYLAGILPGMWFTGLYNGTTQIIPPCLITYVDYVNQTITLSASAVANLSLSTYQQQALFCVATTNTASSTLNNRIVTGSNAYYINGVANIVSSGTTATATTASAHGLPVGSPITISGASASAMNGTFAIYTVPTPTSFTYLPFASSTATSTGATYTSCGLDQYSAAVYPISATASGTSITYTTNGGTFNVGQYVVVSGCVPTDYNVTNVPVTATATNSFTVTSPTTVTDTFNPNSGSPYATTTMGVMPYSNDFADNTTFTRGAISGAGIPANTFISLSGSVTANGTQYISLGAGTGSYNINVGDLVFGTGIPLGTQIAALGYSTPSTFNTATVAASAGTVTFVGSAGWHNLSPNQTVSITGSTSTATANGNSYNLSDVYVTATSSSNVTVIDPTVSQVTSVSTTGTTGNYSYVYVVNAHNYQIGDVVAVTNTNATYNKANSIITAVASTSFTIGGQTVSAASGTFTGYATKVVGTVTSGNGGYLATDQVIQLTNNAASGTISNFAIYNESSFNTNYSNNIGNGYAILSQAATGSFPNTPLALTASTPTMNFAYNTLVLGGGTYATGSTFNGSVFFTSTPATWKNQAYLATTQNNNFLANIIGVPSYYTPLQLISTQSTPITTITQGSTSGTIYVSNASSLTVGNTYMIQGFIIYVTGINTLNNTATVSPAFTSGSPLVLSSTPYANGDAVNNNIYNYEQFFSQGSFINSTDYASTGAGAFSTSSPITRYHQQGMYVGAYAIGNRYFGSQTNQDYEQVYITPPVIGSHVGTTLNQPISANLDTQFIVNPATTSFTTYAGQFGGPTQQNKNFVDLTLGAVGGQAVRSNYVVIVGSGATQEAVLISGQYQTIDNSDVTKGGSGPVSWQLASGQSFQYNHLAGEPVVTPNVNLSQSVITGNVVYGLAGTNQASITNASGNGTTVTYTAANTFVAGQYVNITGNTPISYNLGLVPVFSANSSSFTVYSTATGAFSSGGIAYSYGITPSAPLGYVAYQTTLPHGLSVGNTVVISGCTPTAYNTTGSTVVSVTSPYIFTIANPSTSTPTVDGTVASQNIYISAGLQNLEVGQPIYSLYGNIPANTVVQSITPTTTTSGTVTISNLPSNNTTAQATITSVTPDTSGNNVVYSTTASNFSAGQQVSISMSGSATAVNQTSATIISVTPTSFTTANNFSVNPFSPSTISKVISNAYGLPVTSAYYVASAGRVYYNYTLPFAGGNPLSSGDKVTVSGYTGTTNKKLNLSNVSISSPYTGSAWNGTAYVTNAASGTFSVSTSAPGGTNITVTNQTASATANTTTSVAYYLSSVGATLSAGELVNVYGVPTGGGATTSYNGTFAISSTATSGAYVIYNNKSTNIGNALNLNATMAVIFSNVSGNATSINEPLGTGFTNAHSAFTPVLGGADFGTVASLGYNASPSVIGSNPSNTSNAVVEMHSTFNQPWLTAGTNGSANISTTLAQTASAGATSLLISSNENFPSAYPPLTQSGVNFLPPKLGRLAGSVVSNATTIPFIINGELPTFFPYSVTLGSETFLVGSLGQNAMTISSGATGTYNCLLGYSFTGTTASGTATTITGISSTAIAYLVAGQGIVGSGIPSGTTITNVTASSNSITISNAATVFGTYSFTMATVSSHPDLTPVHLTAMPSSVQYSALDIPYFYLLQNLSIGNTYSSLSTTPVPCAIPAGTTLYIQSGNYSQSLTVATAIPAGATTISVNPFVANYGYLTAVGSNGVITFSGATISVGLGTSLSYNQTVVMAQNGNYQQLIVAKPVSVSSLNVTFQPFYTTYNFTSSANVFAPYAISLDMGNTLETVYPVTIPASQSADGYSDPYLVTLLSPLTYDHSAGTPFQYYSFPSSPAIGDVTYRPDLGSFYMYDGSIWRTSRVLGVQGVYGLLGAANG